MSHGTNVPMTTKLAPPPAAAMPAAVPRFCESNQTERRPITGVVHPWMVKPMTAHMARAKK